MKPSILIVDDERSIRVGLKGLLAKEGYEVSPRGKRRRSATGAWRSTRLISY